MNRDKELDLDSTQNTLLNPTKTGGRGTGHQSISIHDKRNLVVIKFELRRILCVSSVLRI